MEWRFCLNVLTTLLSLHTRCPDRLPQDPVIVYGSRFTAVAPLKRHSVPLHYATATSSIEVSE
jgi:hypothetical protein